MPTYEYHCRSCDETFSVRELRARLPQRVAHFVHAHARLNQRIPHHREHGTPLLGRRGTAHGVAQRLPQPLEHRLGAVTHHDLRGVRA